MRILLIMMILMIMMMVQESVKMCLNVLKGALYHWVQNDWPSFKKVVNIKGSRLD